MAAERIRDNPFYVLGLAPTCTRAELEREGQKLLGMLELKLAAAATYASPLGTHPRTPELVREAMAELRDPARRLRHELWARRDVRAPGIPPPERAVAAEPWPDALTALGWARK